MSQQNRDNLPELTVQEIKDKDSLTSPTQASPPATTTTSLPPALRIVSLIPSATDLCVHLGLGSHVVGITHCCDTDGLPSSVVVVTEDQIDAASTPQGEIHDQVVANGKRAQDALEQEDPLCPLTTDEIPTLYPIRKDLLRQANPTLIITQDLCHVCAPSSETVVLALKEAGIANAKVVLLTPTTLWDVLDNLQQVADAAGISARGKVLCDELRWNLDELSSTISKHRKTTTAAPKKLLVMEWVDPPFCGGHWIPDMAQLIGTELAIDPTPEGRSRQITWKEIDASDPDVVIVACCGFDLARNLVDAENASERFRKLRASSQQSLYAANGDQYFARPSPKLLTGAVIMALCAYSPFEDPELVRAIRALPFAARALDSFQVLEFK